MYLLRTPHYYRTTLHSLLNGKTGYADKQLLLSFHNQNDMSWRYLLLTTTIYLLCTLPTTSSANNIILSVSHFVNPSLIFTVHTHIPSLHVDNFKCFWTIRECKSKYECHHHQSHQHQHINSSDTRLFPLFALVYFSTFRLMTTAGMSRITRHNKSKQ